MIHRAQRHRCCGLTGVKIETHLHTNQSAESSGEMARETPCGDVEHWARGRRSDTASAADSNGWEKSNMKFTVNWMPSVHMVLTGVAYWPLRSRLKMISELMMRMMMVVVKGMMLIITLMLSQIHKYVTEKTTYVFILPTKSCILLVIIMNSVSLLWQLCMCHGCRISDVVT